MKKLKQILRNIEVEPEVARIPIPENFLEFNKLIGFPLNLQTQIESPLFQYELDVVDLLNKHHWLMINKARKIGVSEIILRIIAHKCFTDYKGYQVMIVAGNRVWYAEKLMERFQNLFTRIPEEVADKTASKIVLRNKTEVLAIPSNSTALRGLERVKCIFLDEAAHFNIIDDTKVYSALAPNLANTDGDFITVSTPNGKRGMFYDLWMNPENNFYKHTMPYQVSLGLLLSKKTIEREKRNSLTDFEQEYMCQFTTAQGAIITEDMIEAMEEDYELAVI